MENRKNKSFVNFSWFLLTMVFLVIAAGGIVRMTQSGMGCPDWPKCFGLWIPPINEAQLPADFEKYLSKQDIDHSFNVYHTWVEYINRLLGALLGIFVLAYLIRSFSFWKSDRVIVFVSFILLILTGFQGWLGKLVVDSNLSVVKITIHMVFAILIACIPVFNISRLKADKVEMPKKIKYLQVAFLLLILFQIILGTQVREHIDVISKSLSYESRELWISRVGIDFIIHRSFSWLLLLVSVVVFYFSKSMSSFKRLSLYQLIVILIMVLSGIIMYHFNIPSFIQPVHLLLACFLFILSFYNLLKIK